MSIISRIENDFSSHAVSTEDLRNMDLIREKAKELSLLIAKITPTGREQSLAITHIEDSVFWANAAIARTHPRNSP